MSESFKLGVLQLPSPSGASWRRALQTASAGKNWAVVKLAAAKPELTDERNLVVLLRDGAQALALAPELDAVIILDEPLATICDAIFALYPQNPQKAYAVASERLAAATVLRSLGARVIPTASIAAEFPLLGMISRDSDDMDVAPIEASLDPRPLGMYRTGIPQIGEPIEWLWDVFTYKTTARSRLTPPKIDLTGRARVIFYGPRFHLPPGEWRISLRYFIDVEDRLSSLRFEWGINNDFEILDVNLDRSGFYEIEMTKRWDKTGQAELRVWAATGHFVGSMNVERAAVSYVAP